MSNRAWERRRSPHWIRHNHKWVKLRGPAELLEEFVKSLYAATFLSYIDPKYHDPNNYELVK